MIESRGWVTGINIDIFVISSHQNVTFKKGKRKTKFNVFQVHPNTRIVIT